MVEKKNINFLTCLIQFIAVIMENIATVFLMLISNKNT